MTMPGVEGRGASGLSSSTPRTTSSRGVLGPLAPRRGAVEHFARSSSDSCRDVDGFAVEVKSAVLALAGARAGKVKSTVPLTTVSSTALKAAEERWRSQVEGLGAAPARIQRRALLAGVLRSTDTYCLESSTTTRPCDVDRVRVAREGGCIQNELKKCVILMRGATSRTSGDGSARKTPRSRRLRRRTSISLHGRAS